MWNRIRLIACIVVGLTFARSAIFHLENPFAFLRAIESYGLLPTAVSQVAAALLPFVMLSVSLALLFSEELQKVALKLSLFLSIAFVVAQAITVIKGIEIDCGCFGPSEYSVIGFRSISLPAFLGVLSLVCLLWEKCDVHAQDLSEPEPAVALGSNAG